MAFSMHSHSGQFCCHAKDTLEAIVQRAIALHMRHFALTEHMPRYQAKDLYLEEVEAGITITDLQTKYEAYITEALRLRETYKDAISLLIGFEGEWIRPSLCGPAMHALAQNPAIDFFIGSVHHVHDIPIDFDAALYARARAAAGGTDERLFGDYFDAQYEMLKAVRPRVVGHFDLVRLLSDEPDRDLKTMDGVWARVTRNLALVREQGGLLEVNSSALRKGLREPYPGRSVCEEFLRLGGKFTLSDDSHCVAQVGLNFGRAIRYLQTLGVERLHYLERQELDLQTPPKPPLVVNSVLLADLEPGNYVLNGKSC